MNDNQFDIGLDLDFGLGFNLSFLSGRMDSFKLMSLVFLFSFSFFFSCSSRVTKFSSRKSRFSEDFEKGSKFSNREVLKERLETRSEFLNIFLLPHSHCDAGWIKTFDVNFSLSNF